MAGKTLKKFNCRYEELPVVGSLLLTSLERDKTDFINYSPNFNERFITNFKTTLTEVDEIIHPQNLKDEISFLNNRMTNLMNSSKDLLSRLEGYVTRTTSLRIKPDDFGIKTVLDRISQGDVEGFTEKLKIVLKNIDDNITALKHKGYSDEARTSLMNIHKSLKDANTEQYNKLKTNENHIVENTARLNELWDMMHEIMNAGETLYKITRPTRFEDYSWSKLQIRAKKETTKVIEEEKTH